MHSEEHCPGNKGKGAGSTPPESDSHYESEDWWYSDEPVDSYYDEYSGESYDAYDVYIEDHTNGDYWQRRWYRKPKGKSKGKGKRHGRGRGKSPAFPRSPFGRKPTGKGGQGRGKGKGKRWKKGGGRGKRSHYSEDGIHFSSFTGMTGVAEGDEEEEEDYQEEDESSTSKTEDSEPVGYVPDKEEEKADSKETAEEKAKRLGDAHRAIFGQPKTRSPSDLGLSNVLSQPKSSTLATSSSIERKPALGLIDSLLCSPPGLQVPSPSTKPSGVPLPPAPMQAPASWSSNEVKPDTPVTPVTRAVPALSLSTISPVIDDHEEITLEDKSCKTESRVLETPPAVTTVTSPKADSLGATVSSAVESASDNDWTNLRLCRTCHEVGEWHLGCDHCGAQFCSRACFGTFGGRVGDSPEFRICSTCKTSTTESKDELGASASSTSSAGQSFYKTDIGQFFMTHSYDVDYTCVPQHQIPDTDFTLLMKEIGVDHDPTLEDLEDISATSCAFLFGHMFGSFNQTHNKIFTSVKGVQQPGLLIDPGASKALIGMDTLKRIIDQVLRPKGLLKHMKWSQSAATFQGINPNPERSLGLVSFPIGLTGMSGACFKADVIGGKASLCPGLVPLRTLSALNAVIMCGWYPDGDGILGLWHNQKWSPQHLYRTDSGHYLLRIDNFNKITDPKKKSAVLQSTNEVVRATPWSKQDTVATLHSSNRGAWSSSHSPKPKAVFH